MQVLDTIDRGAFARVERVQMEDGSILARKVLDPDNDVRRSGDMEHVKKRFRREVRIQQGLVTDLFIPVLESDLQADPPWFTMPLAERNLAREIEEKGPGRVPNTVWADILDGMEAIHLLGYVHRDLKPSNILYHEGRWKLSDFGLIQPVFGGTTRFTNQASTWGTEMYCSPEQLQDFQNCSDTADIYSFGCILYDAFIGGPRVPFQQYTYPSKIGWIIEKCTDIDPGKRFAKVSLLREALLEALAEQEAHMAPSNTSATSSEWLGLISSPEGWDEGRVSSLIAYTRNVSQEELWDFYRSIDAKSQRNFRLPSEDHRGSHVRTGTSPP